MANSSLRTRHINLKRRKEFYKADLSFNPRSFRSSIWKLLTRGMYDGPTAFAEAGLMAARVSRRNRILILDSADKRLFDVADAYTRHQSVRDRGDKSRTAC